MKLKGIKKDLSNIKQNDYVCDFFGSPTSFRTVDGIYKNKNRTMIVIRHFDGRYAMHRVLPKSKLIEQFKKVEHTEEMKGLSKCKKN